MIGFVNIKDLDGTVDRLMNIKPGKKTHLDKTFEEYYGEHESLLFRKTGVGLRKIKDEGDVNKYICIRAV